MTHAGLLCLELARRSLGLSRHPARVELAARKGHAWCDERYTVTECPFGSGFHDGYYPYYMWGMARYAIVHERKEIGGRDWYREGAEELLRRQEKNGSWGNLDDTALCMLFLRKAALTEPAPRPVDPDEDGTGTPEAKSSEVWRRELPPKPKFAPRSDVPSIRSWLVLGPFTETGVDDTMLVKDHFPVARIKPREGASVGGKRWALYTSPEDVVDLDKAAGDSQYSAVYAATWLHAGVDTEILLWVASDDGMRVFLEGKELLHSPHHDWSGDDRYALPVRLEAGAHLLLVKVSDVGYYCRLRVRVTDLEGIPAPGVEARPGPWAARKR
jgi:hypothetical protein